MSLGSKHAHARSESSMWYRSSRGDLPSLVSDEKASFGKVLEAEELISDKKGQVGNIPANNRQENKQAEMISSAKVNSSE